MRLTGSRARPTLGAVVPDSSPSGPDAGWREEMVQLVARHLRETVAEMTEDDAKRHAESVVDAEKTFEVLDLRPLDLGAALTLRGAAPPRALLRRSS